MAVDADVVALEACHRRLEALPPGVAPAERRAELLRAAVAIVPTLLTSLVIGALAFVPVFAFGGETGRLLWPLALAKTLVMAAAAVVALTLAPALRDRLLRGPVVAELANPLVRGLIRAYRPLVELVLRWPAVTLLTAALAVLSCVPLLPRIGAEFLPRLDEGNLLFMPTTASGASMAESSAQLAMQDQRDRRARRGRGRAGQDRPRRHGDQSRAAVDGGDDRRSRAAGGVAEGTPRPLVFGVGARGAQGAPPAAWPDETERDLAELTARLESRGAVAGMDERVDRARSRAHGHDVDGGPHAAGDSHHRGQPGPARRARGRAARLRPAGARDPQRQLRIVGRRDRPALRRSISRRWRDTVQTPRWRRRPPIC